jgi:hypothetical protein
MRRQISLHWIQMHVLQLFRDLPAGPNIEVIKTSFPEMLLDEFSILCEQCARKHVVLAPEGPLKDRPSSVRLSADGHVPA